MSIRLSPKHGVNPSVGQCFYCLQDDGTIVLPGMLKGDAEAPRRACWTKEPCPKCKEWMKVGIIMISVDEKKTEDPEDPWRTGRFAVVKEEAFKRWGIGPKELKDDILKRRVCFVPDDAWEKLGLPMEDIPEEKTDA